MQSCELYDITMNNNVVCLYTVWIEVGLDEVR